MSYVVSSLASYTKEDANKIIYKLIASEGTTSKLMQVQTGVKSAETINIVSTDGVWQANSNCGFSASGDTTFTQRTITVGKIKVDLKWCEQQLEPKFLQNAMKAGSNYDMLTFREDIVNDFIQKQVNKKEIAIWQGDTTSLDQSLLHFDGLIKIIGAASGVLTATPVAWSVANSRTAVQNAISTISDNMLANPNLKMFMGLSEARDYRLKLGIDNLYHYTGAENKLYAENSDIEIVPVLGLSGTKKVYVMSTDNMFLGTDLENEDENFKLFYAQEADEIRLTAKWKMGVQVAFPDQIVKQVNT